MKYIEINQSHNLLNEIHNYWELKGDKSSNNWERIFPDGCPGLIMNLGDTCSTDNGTVKMEHGKTYMVGAMTTFKESYINENTHLIGVCLKPSAFASFFSYCSLSEIKNNTVLFDKNLSFDRDWENSINFVTDECSTSIMASHFGNCGPIRKLPLFP